MLKTLMLKRCRSASGYVALTMYAVFALFPLLWMLIISFKSDAQMFDTTFIFTPTLENYTKVLLNSSYIKSFWQNIIVSGGAVLLSIAVGVPAAYAFARFNFKGKENFAFTILSFRFAPEILIIIPLYMIYQGLKLYDTYWGLIWVYQFICLPLIIWVLRGYFEDISIDIEDAARLDGYKWWQVFLKTLMPLVKPGLVAAGLLSFIFAWNSFTFSMILAGFNIQTVTVSSLRFLASDTVHYGQMAVAATIATLPEIALCLAIQKHLVRGLSFGAIKG